MIKITDALVTLKELRRQVERVPSIDWRNGTGIELSPGTWQPSFTFKHVSFAYPTQPDKAVLRDVSVHIESGKVTAFVGESGSSKSTIVSLLVREYDPTLRNMHVDRTTGARSHLSAGLEDSDEKGLRSMKHDSVPSGHWGNVGIDTNGDGIVEFAGRDIRDYNVRWMRSQLAVVSQQPQLFTATVFENVAAGLTGTSLEFRPGIDDLADALPSALVKAQALDFVSKLPHGIDTIIGKLPHGIDTIIGNARGAGLSGGQRQRLAIARALVRKPACLILAEATSALDTETEDAIRIVLEREVKDRGMTVVMIAHRMSTIINADTIIVMHEGQVVDQGSYQNLICEDRVDQTFRKMAAIALPSSSIGMRTAEETVQQPPSVRLIFEESRGAGKSTLETGPSGQDESKNESEPWKRDLEVASPTMEPESKRDHGGAVVRAMIKQRWLFSAGFVGALLAGAAFPIAGANIFCLEIGSEDLMRRLRKQSMKALVRQEISFFDEANSSSGGLTSAVSTHPNNVGGATGVISGQLIVALANLSGSLLIGLILDWKTALVTVPLLLVLLFSGWLNTFMLEKHEESTSSSTAGAASFINEHVDAVRTVKALGRERETMRVFRARFRAEGTRKRLLFLGTVGFALSYGSVMCIAGLVFYRGSQRLADGVDIVKLFAVVEVITIAAFASSRIFTFVGDYARAIHSFKQIQIWLRREPRYASLSIKKKLPSSWADGDIVLRDVELRYPQRPEIPALDGMSLRILAGKRNAICGTSGSGKTSIMATIQRFYDPSPGIIMLGDVDLRGIPLQDLRSSIAYVSQDSVLFQGTVRWNVSLGALKSDSVTEEQVKRVCEQAHIWDFVTSLLLGLDSEIGMKGCTLSGGQRQRLCIARALIRNPRVLLLDGELMG
ncbi:hypothetical protein QFC20_005909 [Naganishia adeliensis]|uniref:Uncharacterized protein n=1 Tax=Naganishia adeliensis TaxID=92952 RepID=A0ACC2VJ45_9TREE|nr:hypothetical protein QFC20_005909 [Naganishia adeliensis]